MAALSKVIMFSPASTSTQRELSGYAMNRSRDGGVLSKIPFRRFSLLLFRRGTSNETELANDPKDTFFF
jgi:hypothetical protein